MGIHIRLASSCVLSPVKVPVKVHMWGGYEASGLCWVYICTLPGETEIARDVIVNEHC